MKRIVKAVQSVYPSHLGRFRNINPEEFQHVVYMPIKGIQSGIRIPDGLAWAAPLVAQVAAHLANEDGPKYREGYLYLTVKHSWVDKGQVGNRAGWHIDGWGSNGDRNFIWCDSTPPLVMIADKVLDMDHARCLVDLDIAGTLGMHRGIEQLEPFTLYDLGESIHQCAPATESGMRAFVKISWSPDRYDLLGNARNPLLPCTHWAMHPRNGTRNHPTAQPGNGRAEAYKVSDNSDTWNEIARRVQGEMAQGVALLTATHGIHKGTTIVQPDPAIEVHNEGSLEDTGPTVYGLPHAEYVRQRARCQERCHPETCNHPWSK